MKYAVIDQTKSDWFEDVFDTEKEAIAHADYMWRIMAEYDKKRIEEFFVASCELNEDGTVDVSDITALINLILL